jgi:3-hydroxybutyryl-CoA dehydrogenase
MDHIGIDVALGISLSLYEQSYNESRFRPHPMLKYMVEAGLLGKKSKKGFFEYEEEK